MVLTLVIPLQSRRNGRKEFHRGRSGFDLDSDRSILVDVRGQEHLDEKSAGNGGAGDQGGTDVQGPDSDHRSSHANPSIDPDCRSNDRFHRWSCYYFSPFTRVRAPPLQTLNPPVGRVPVRVRP
jgi:hypothetical protein